MKRVIRVGSRDSTLAVAQTELVLNDIIKVHPKIEFVLVTMKTTGDKILDKSLDKVGGKGLFVKELDYALMEGVIDLAIHSLKDLPMEENPEIPILGFSKREDPRDGLILKSKVSPDFTEGCIGTSSRRRMEQLKKLYPKATFQGIRGNVQTRLRKLEEENYDATVLAMAGLKRINMAGCVSRIFSVDEMIPAAGQGILAFQGRKGENYDFLSCVCNEESAVVTKAERSFVTYLNGGCSSPVAAYASVTEDMVTLRGLYYHEQAEDYSVGIKRGNRKEAEKIGEELAKELQAKWK